jgi:RHS repeat-associated protein
VYGLELISKYRQFVANNQGQTQISYYLYDGHGSVRALTSTTGVVTDTYDYDAFGNLIHSSGTTPNNYLFAGEQFDPDLNLYYNRARYLNTSTGRFWSMDTDEGDGESPFSLHKYLYAGNDPINRIDPSGNDFDLASTLTATTGGVTIFGMSALQSAIVIQSVTGALFASSFAGIGAALEGQTPRSNCRSNRESLQHRAWCSARCYWFIFIGFPIRASRSGPSLVGRWGISRLQCLQARPYRSGCLLRDSWTWRSVSVGSRRVHSRGCIDTACCGGSGSRACSERGPSRMWSRQT